MGILVTNDDGIHAPGLLALARALAPLGEVTVIAPERQQSAAGHGITLHKPLRMTPMQIDAPVLEAFATNGTPADCTILATADGRPVPDLVVAGINAGANLGEEVLYSGTASAAMEGALQGIRSFAISVTAYDECIFEPAAEFAARLARRVVEGFLPPDTFLNVNVPNVCGEDLGPAVITRLGRREYVNSLDRRVDPRGRSYYWFSGEPREGDCEEGTDIGAIHAGRISVTPVHFDMNFRGPRGEIEVLLDGLAE
ncbi:MAG: 5'/3'-nucleotidase SurE [Armatimonadota bacterium]|jgi:5'-nucleotidase